MGFVAVANHKLYLDFVRFSTHSTDRLINVVFVKTNLFCDYKASGNPHGETIPQERASERAKSAATSPH
jgi:hypothetical protein